LISTSSPSSEKLVLEVGIKEFQITPADGLFLPPAQTKCSDRMSYETERTVSPFNTPVDVHEQRVKQSPDLAPGESSSISEYLINVLVEEVIPVSPSEIDKVLARGPRMSCVPVN
jgi:hypothetical protein